MKFFERRKFANVYAEWDDVSKCFYGTLEYVRLREILTDEDYIQFMLAHKGYREEGFCQPIWWFEYIPLDEAMWKNASTKRDFSRNVLKFALKELKRNWHFHNLPYGW